MKKKTKEIAIKHILLLSLSVVGSQGYSAPTSISASFVPLDGSRIPSADLMFQGRQLTPDQAKVESEQNGVDLSRLDPSEDNNLWKATQPELPSDFDDLGINNGDVLSKVKQNFTKSGIASFTAQKKISGRQTPFQFILSRNSHTFLLRRSLLRKIGYNIPPIRHLKTLTLHFQSTLKKEKFILDMSKAVLGDANRWIKENIDESKTLVMQDLIVRETRHKIIDLSAGVVVPSVVVGKRIMRSLVIPYSLVNVDESVNMFAWNSGKLINNNLHFPIPNPEINNFFPTIDDAKWSARRILRLTRTDFTEIVRSSRYPIEVEKVLIEKIISRRNDLIRLLDLDAEIIPFNPKISHGDRLVNGKLTLQEGAGWPGYASRFTFGDPDSPLAATQLVAFGRSILRSNILSNTMTRVNQLILSTDLNRAVRDHQIQNLRNSITHFQQTGEIRSTPIGAWVTPTANANLILSRDVIAGPHMGTDNLVQLADTVGFSVRAGAFIGVDGIRAPTFASGNATVSYTKRFSHLKPIFNMTTALEEPFRNVIVPTYMQSISQSIDNILLQETTMKSMLLQLNEIEESSDSIDDSSLLDLISVGLNPAKIIALLSAGDSTGEQLSQMYMTHLISEDTIQQLRSEEDDIDMGLLHGLSENSLKIISLGKFSSTDELMTFLKEDDRISKALSEINDDRQAAIKSLLSDDVESRIQDLAKERKRTREKLVQQFKDNLGVGESLIISDSITGDVGFRVSTSFYDIANLNAAARLNATSIEINRLHIHRKDKNTVQIYKDEGDKLSLSMSIELNGGVPISTFSASRTRGKARTKYYSLNISNNLDAETLTTNLNAIRDVVNLSSLEQLDAIKKPFFINHKFTERSLSFGLLWFRANNLRGTDRITVENSKGDKKDFYTFSHDESSGRNYQQWAIGAINLMIDNFAISNRQGSAAGTIKGRSVIRKIRIEGELINRNGRKVTDEDFASITWQWRGWSIKKDRAQHIFDDINKKFDHIFIEDTFLNDTKNIQLYNLNLRMLIYDDAIKNMVALPDTYLLNKFEKYTSSTECELYWPTDDGNVDEGCEQVIEVLRAKKSLTKAIKQKKWDKIAKEKLHLLRSLDDLIDDYQDLIEIFGGAKNIYIYATLAGFLNGDERGDDREGHTLHRPFTFQTLGKFGSENRFGPLQTMQNFLGMTPSEFYALWIRRQL